MPVMLIEYKILAFIGKFVVMTDVTKEIRFKTTRSGGKGGQHVNKVETAVEGYWSIDQSQLFDEQEKKGI